jgi:hypothetical protein
MQKVIRHRIITIKAGPALPKGNAGQGTAANWNPGPSKARPGAHQSVSHSSRTSRTIKRAAHFAPFAALCIGRDSHASQEQGWQQLQAMVAPHLEVTFACSDEGALPHFPRPRAVAQ